MPAPGPAGSDWVRVHPPVVRVCHWINLFAVLIMVTSGWAIYNASPLFAGFRFPYDLTLGGWLAGALQWHFAAMWLLGLNGLVYLAYGIASGHFRRKLLPLSPRAVLHDVGLAARYADEALLLFGDGRWLHGPEGEVLRAPNIEQLYGLPVRELTWSSGRTYVPA